MSTSYPQLVRVKKNGYTLSLSLSLTHIDTHIHSLHDLSQSRYPVKWREFLLRLAVYRRSYNSSSLARAGIQTASAGFDEVSCHDVSLHWSPAHLGPPSLLTTPGWEDEKEEKGAKNWPPHLKLLTYFTNPAFSTNNNNKN